MLDCSVGFSIKGLPEALRFLLLGSKIEDSVV